MEDPPEGPPNANDYDDFEEIGDPSSTSTNTSNYRGFKRPSNFDENGDEIFLETKKSAKKVWLVKVPAFIAEKWNSIDKAGVNLGTLDIDQIGR
ncbi:hypothetical protein HDU76_008396, partial [Blyttiomyces sp. JEL0837]